MVLQKSADDFNTKVNKNDSKIKRMKEKLEEQETTVIEAGNEVNLVDELRKRDEDKLKTFQKELEKSEEIMATFHQKLPEIQRKMSESKSRISELGAMESDLNEKVGDMSNELNNMDKVIISNRKRVFELKDSKQLFKQKMEAVLKNNRNPTIADSLALLNYLDREMEALQAQGKLRGEVYGPVAMHVQVTTDIAAVIIEKSCGFRRWYSFLTTCDEDSDYIKAYNKSKGLNIDIFTMKNLNLPHSTLSPQYLEGFKSIGMIGYLSSQIVDCPDVVRSYLHHWNNIHNILWASRDESHQPINDKHYAQLCPENTGGFRLYMHSKPTRQKPGKYEMTEFTGSKSRYTNKMSTRSNGVAIHDNFQGVLQYGGEQGAEKKIELERESEEMRVRMQPIIEKFNASKETLGRVKDEMADLKGMRAECQKVLNLPKTTEQKILQEKKKIRDIEQKLSKGMKNEKNDKLRAYEESIDSMVRDFSATIGLCAGNTALKVEVTAAACVRSLVVVQLAGIQDQILECREGLGVFEKALSDAERDRYVLGCTIFVRAVLTARPLYFCYVLSCVVLTHEKEGDATMPRNAYHN